MSKIHIGIRIDDFKLPGVIDIDIKQKCAYSTNVDY